MLRYKTIIILLFLIILNRSGVFAQAGQAQGMNQSVIEKLDKYNGKLPDERLYLHFDKFYYAVGDTIWFKGYLVNSKIAYSPLSSRIYVDLINDSNRIVKHYIFPASLGITVGSICLDNNILHAGTYTLRAYSSWMRNLGDDRLFYFHFFIADPGGAGIKNSGSFLLSSSKPATKTKDLTRQHDLHASPGIDMQFMAEGGYLVDLLPAHVAFKAIGEDGRGVDVKGVILDKENHVQARFESVHKGMGAFDFVPQDGETYTAQLNLPGGETKSVALPVAKSSGTVLNIKNLQGADSLEISISASQGMQGKTYNLIGQLRGLIYYAGAFSLNRDMLTIRLAKSLFPTGVVHFTLFDTENQPLNERITFVDHNDNLKLEINTASGIYKTRDSIPIKINVNDNKGNPVVGSFSLAVTDDSQVKPADLLKKNIFTQLLLTPDLKGYIEDPAYYFSADKNAAIALDNLMLTQGWVGYKWKEGFNDAYHPAYEAESKYTIRGKVGNLLNKPIPNASITLLGTGRYKLFKDTVSDSNGNFLFKNLPVIDSPTYVLQARKAKGRIINAGITIAENDIPAVVLPAFPTRIQVSDSTMMNFEKNSLRYRNELTDIKYGSGTHLLKAVDIKDKAIIRGSKNLNGPGNYDQAITRDEIEKTGKISLLQLIEKKVTGFQEGHIHKDNDLSFMIKEKRVRFVVDGIDLDRFYDSVSGIPNEHYNYQRETLDYLSAEDITGIEVIYSMRYNALYNERNLTTDEQLAIAPSATAGADVAYLEITTRSGNGPFIKPATGILVYKPAPITFPFQFYRPRYSDKKIDQGFTDLRSTIHWEPNIVTNKAGTASTSFYAADQPTTYTIILQGADLNGKVGFIMQKLTISTK
jgi:hypothetical protein